VNTTRIARHGSRHILTVRAADACPLDATATALQYHRRDVLTHRPRAFVALAAFTVGPDLVVSSLYSSYAVSVTVLFSLGAIYALAQALGAFLFIRNAREAGFYGSP
jgi:hypothetical protein